MINIYDFDNTIYDGDSTIDFYIFSILHQPSLIRYLPHQFKALFLYTTKKYDKTKFKTEFFIFLKGVSDIEYLLTKFWKKHKIKIKNWYLNQHQNTDIIISASPEFLISPICKELNISKVIASQVDIKTGQFYQNNCFGIEKVNRIKKELMTWPIQFEFYSDSLSDKYLAALSENAFLVKKNKIYKWPQNKMDGI